MAQMKYYYELTISSSPHVHSPVTTTTIMRDVLIALLPAMLGAVYFFGFRALTVGIPSGRELTTEELDYLTAILMCWIREHSSGAENIPHTPYLF